MIEDYIPVIIIHLILSIIFLFLGFLVKKYKLGNIISGFNPKKDDPDIICPLFGENFIFLGILGLVLIIISYFAKGMISLKFFSITYYTILTVVVINIYYRMHIIRKNSNQ
ncbi:DUF3784 domain-containing protein [Oceanirhabdus seepicola]|uniref:DUF3784 domain-containing protein n=1 Tax=Oceanirhabdus seepicola TaxID=2828781 RepID=A0A9J6P5B0_9CLOT|nr:DUF3784 domain-containing protein [Oceanirhabdus seepicola]MCM1990981.1 hypothetical protein [Oceanirhabdus seepicola]